jgi:hypothetical protein
MVNITERIGDVLISTEENDIYLKKGTIRPILSNGYYVIIRRKDQEPVSATPVFKITKLGEVGTVTDADGNDIAASSLLDLLLQTSDFFSN